MTASRRLKEWDRSLDSPVDLRALGMLRIAIGPIVLIHLRPFLGDALNGIIYSDRFSVNFWDWYPHLPRLGYVALLWAIAGATILLSMGWHTRVVAWFVVGGLAYNVFLSQTHFRHNRAFLIILLVGLAVLPSGKTVSLDARRARRLGRPLVNEGGSRLALLVLRVEIATVYLASGFSKLIDSDWWGGTVTRLRIEQNRPRLAEVGFPHGLIDLLADPAFQAFAAKILVFTELFIGLGLLWRRTRLAAIWVAIPFHVAIQFSAAVQVFSLAALAALVVWIDTPSHDRAVYATGRWRTVIEWLDWTGRFRVGPSHAGLRVGDGPTRLIGPDAFWFLLSRLPLTFWIAAPVNALRHPGR